MRPILANILTSYQHLSTLERAPERYCPDQCPHCYKSGLWRHGVYYRQAQCEHQGNPIPIPRFFCADCQRTCSTLPEYIPPRRWYYWLTQQLALIAMMMGQSLLNTLDDLSKRLPTAPCLSTLHRWHGWLKRQFPQHQFHLCVVYPWLRHQFTYAAFWSSYVEEEGPFSGAMCLLNQARQIVP